MAGEIKTQCVECGRLFAAVETIRIGDSTVCAACKPIFLQKIAEGVAPKVRTSAPIFFQVSTLKLVLLSIVSFGGYEIYWLYKNWSFERDRTNEDMRPLARALFAPLFSYALFRRIADFGQRNPGEGTRFAPGLLAAVFIALTITARLPEPLSLLSNLSVIPLVVIQRSVREINRIHAPNADPNLKFSAANIVLLIVGGLVFLLAIAGMLLPEPSGPRL